MRIPALRGLIRRRILVNFRVDPEVVQRQLPAPFRPKLVGDSAMAGICLIRLEQIRPRFVSWPVGLASENAAHRVAVCWTDTLGRVEEGVYVPRRDSNSRWNQLAGGRLFPGEHHEATFDIRDNGETIGLTVQSKDGRVTVELKAHLAVSLPRTSRFASVGEASAFFERGSLGYSAKAEAGHLDGLYLCTQDWRVEPLEVESVQSSYFTDDRLFPAGSVQFDSALLMRNIPHEWRSAPELPVISS